MDRNNEVNEEIKGLLENNNLILFVGSGVSASLGMPNWSQLINHIADQLGFEHEVFKTYGDYLALAEYYYLKQNGPDELCEWMAEKWTVNKEAIYSSPIYNAIVSLSCKLIYTTNYDHTLEQAYDNKKKNYIKIVDINDLVGIQDDAVQIIKFHGDFSKKDSIILSERDYFNRLNFESPLDIKLRSDMLGNSILFIGYSLSDINIRFLIYKLDQMWRISNKMSERPKLYIFLSKPNPIQEDIFRDRGIVPIIGEGLDETESLRSFLEKLSN